MHRGRFLVLLLATVLTGCLDSGPDRTPPAPTDVLHVLVIGGSVEETGPEPQPQGVCDIAQPPFSADDDQQRIWYVATEWHQADPRDAHVAAIRVDETDKLWEDGCWSPQLQSLEALDQLVWWHPDVPERITVVATTGGVMVGGKTLKPGEVYDWTIDTSCTCTQNDVHGTYRYQGVLHVQYLGAWSRDNIIITDYEHLPPLDVPYWESY